MIIDRISSRKMRGDTGNSFAAIEIDGDGVVVRNAVDERDSTGNLVLAGSDEVLSARRTTGTTINASYIKSGVIDANLMRAGLIQTVPSWNTKWYGAPEDHAAVQMGFTGGSIAATVVSTGSGTVSLTLPGGHGLITGDYVRVSGLYFTTGTLLGSVGLNLPTNGPVDYASATVSTNTLTYSKSDITSGLTASTASTVYVGKAHAISSLARTFDDPSNPAELSTVVVTTSAAHGFSVGDYVELANVAETIDGVAYITAVTSTTFTFKQRFGDDLELDFSESDFVLPSLLAPVAIKVIKAYTQNSDGSIHITSGTVDSTLIVGEIAATEITIGSGEGVVRVGSYPDAISPTFQGIWAGSANPSTAEFSANTSGAVTASDLTVTGGSINIGNFTLSTQGNITEELVIEQKFITNEAGVDLISTESDGGNAYALGPSLSRAIETGIINGDFGSTPPTVGSAINNSTNRLPYFSVESTAGTTITVKSVADATAASGYVLRFTIPTSANVGDVCRVYRYVAVPGSAARTWTNQPRAAWRNATGTTKTEASVAIRTQYYQNDSTTAVGTAGNNSATFATIAASTYAYETQANPNGTGSIPQDGAYLRIAVGVVVNSAPTSELTVDLTEVRYDRGLIQLLLADQIDPDTYGYGVAYLNNGAMWIAPNETGTNGGSGGTANPQIMLSSLTGNVNLRPSSTGSVVAQSKTTGGSAAAVPLKVFGIASQTGNLQQWLDVSSNVLAYVDSAGMILGSSLEAQSAANRDAIIISGRAGGTSNWAATFTPTTLTANRTITVPNASGTMALTSDLTGTTFDLTGDVTVTAGSFTLGAANSYVVSVDNDSHSHTLGTTTTGNYVATVTSANTLISVSGSGVEGAAITLTADTSPTFTGLITGSGGAELSGAIDLNSTVSATSLSGTSSITNSQDVRIFFSTGGGLAQWRVFRDTSSERYKTNIVYMDNSDSILDVQPVTYHDKVQFEEIGSSSPRQYGFLAEDMAANVDGRDYVVFNDDGTPEAIQYSRLVVPLHSAMRALRARIEELETRIAELETGA